MRKPIDNTTHVAIDHVFAAAMFAAPSVLSFHGPARRACYILGATIGLVNNLTDNRLSPSHKISLKTHGRLETPFVPALLVLPAVTGAFNQRIARWFFGTYFVAALTNYLLTDYDAPERDDDAVLVAADRVRHAGRKLVA